MLTPCPQCSPGQPSFPGPVSSPVLSALSRLLARRTWGTVGAAAPPASGPGPTWGLGAWGAPLFSCVTEEVPLSRARAWGGGGGGGCGTEGLGEALGSILPMRKAGGQTRQDRPLSLLWPLAIGKKRGSKGRQGRLPSILYVTSPSLATAPRGPPSCYRRGNQGGNAFKDAQLNRPQELGAQALPSEAPSSGLTGHQPRGRVTN